MDLFTQELDNNWNFAVNNMKSVIKEKWISESSFSSFVSEYSSIKSKRITIGLSGPGASGKTTVLNELVLNHGFSHLLNVTTRKPRINEKNGIDYRFYSEDSFEKEKKDGKFISTVEKSGRGKYGILLTDYKQSLQKNKVVLIESPLVLSYVFSNILLDSLATTECILFYLLPSPPIISNLITFLSNRQESLTHEEISINHGWRQIEEFSSLIAVNNKVHVFVLEGIDPHTIADAIGQI